MLKLEDVTALISEHAEALGEEVMADIGVKLLEKDAPIDTGEIDRLTAELEAEKAGRAEDKKSYIERINKFVYGGDPGPGPEPEVVPETENKVAVEEKSFYERMYGDD